jgi:hypothetical protein
MYLFSYHCVRTDTYTIVLPIIIYIRIQKVSEIEKKHSFGIERVLFVRLILRHYSKSQI